MKKVIVKNLAGSQIAGAQLADPTSWIENCVSNNYWGLPERWVPHKDEGGFYDDADFISERMAEIVPAVPFQPEIPAVYEGGNLISEAIPAVPEVPAVMQKQAKLRAEYTIEITDISQQIEQERINNEALAYLASTDWLIIREMDSGLACPAEIKDLRQAAREAIIQ
jgi:hypothetical protein